MRWPRPLDIHVASSVCQKAVIFLCCFSKPFASQGSESQPKSRLFLPSRYPSAQVYTSSSNKSHAFAFWNNLLLLHQSLAMLTLSSMFLKAFRPRELGCNYYHHTLVPCACIVRYIQICLTKDRFFLLQVVGLMLRFYPICFSLMHFIELFSYPTLKLTYLLSRYFFDIFSFHLSTLYLFDLLCC